MNAIFLVHTGKTSQASVPGNSRLIDGIFALKRGCLRIISSIDGILLASSKFGQHQLVIKNWPGDASQSETGK